MKKARLGLSAKKRDVKQASSQRTELYRSCSLLPLNIFIDAIIDDNLKGLIIKGTPTDEEISEAWEFIYCEYLEISKSARTEYLLQLQNDIRLLEDEELHVGMAIYLLHPNMRPYCLGREGELIKILRYYGYNQTIDFNSPDYDKVISVISSRIAMKKLRLDGKRKELKEYLDANKTGKPSRIQFDNILVRLSRFQGYHIRAAKITVSEYLTIFNDCVAANDKPKEVTDGR